VNETPVIVQLADDAYQAIRMLNHRTVRGAIPAPVLYDVLGSLKLLGPALEQAIRQFGDGLQDSLSEYDVYDDDDDPAVNVALCRDILAGAAHYARLLAESLEASQSTIAHQGYRLQQRTGGLPRAPS